MSKKCAPTWPITSRLIVICYKIQHSAAWAYCWWQLTGCGDSAPARLLDRAMLSPGLGCWLGNIAKAKVVKIFWPFFAFRRPSFTRVTFRPIWLYQKIFCGNFMINFFTSYLNMLWKWTPLYKNKRIHTALDKGHLKQSGFLGSHRTFVKYWIWVPEVFLTFTSSERFFPG
jgi:hypothetical protein